MAVKTRRDSGFEVTASQVLVTNGGKQAIANSFAVLCDPGDEVLVLAPYWTTYPEVIRLAGGVPVVIATDAASGFRATIDQLEAARTPRTKVLLFVSPSNPTGAVYPRPGDPGHRRVGRGAGAVGPHRRDLRAPGVRGGRAPLDAGAGPRAGRSRASWSTAWPRPTP